MPLTTAVIKQQLSSMGYTNSKRISKRKDTNKDILREFSTNQGNILVRSDPSDTVVLAINPSGLANAKIAPAASSSSLANLIPISAPRKLSDFLNRNQEQQLEQEINKIGASKYTIYAIPEVNEIKNNQYVGYGSFETLLVITDVGNFVWDAHYLQTFHLASFSSTSRDISGVWIDTDFELVDPGSWMEINIPKGSYIKYSHPEYMKVIALSNDLTQGITSVSFGMEPTVDSSKNDLVNIGFLEADSICDWADDPVEFSKMYQKYDFVNSNM